MSHRESPFRRLMRESRRELILEGIRHLGYAAMPLGWSALTAVFAYTEKLPLAYASAAVAVVFAGAGVGALQFHNLIYQRTPKGKLRFGKLLLATIRRQDGSNTIEKVQIGVELNTISLFPMQAQFSEVTTILESRIVTEKNPAPLVDIDAFGMGCFYDYAIDVADMDLKNKTLNGELRFGVVYGRGALRYHLLGDYRVHIAFETPEKIRHFTWHQIPRRSLS